MITIAAVLFMNVAHADMTEKTDQLCEKMKTCAVEQMGADQPPGIVEMMKGMFDSMCASMIEPYATTFTEEGLEDKAEACMDSILETSCEVLMASQGDAHESPECKEFEAAADEAGVDLGN